MNLSTYLANKLTNAVLRNVAYTLPTTVYLHLYTSDPTKDDTGTEVSDTTGYAAQAVTFAAAVDGICENSGDIEFPVATADQGIITHGGIRDNTDNLLWFGPLSSVQTVKLGAQLKFLANSIRVGFSTTPCS